MEDKSNKTMKSRTLRKYKCGRKDDNKSKEDKDNKT